MKSIKVAMISPLGYTGLAYYDYSLCQTLSEDGVDVQLFTSDNWLLSQYPASFGIQKAYTNCSGSESKIKKGINYVKSTVGILWRVLRSDATIVHFQIVEVPAIDLVAMFLFRLGGKKIVFTPHDIDHNKNFPLSNSIMKAMYRLSHRIIVHKEANAEMLESSYGITREKLLVTRHGGYSYFLDDTLDRATSREKLGLPADVTLILFFGTIKKGKGLEVLLPAVADLSTRMTSLYLLIAGKPVGEITAEKMSSEIHQNGLEAIAHLRCDFIPDNEVEYYYKAADIVVLPYTHLSESGVVKYAQSCGCTVVCSDKEEFHDTVQDGVTGAFFKSGDSTDLSRVMETVLTTYDLDTIGEAARTKIEQSYGWKEIGHETRQLYLSTLS